MRKQRRKISQCKNCLTQLNINDNFCSNCGQENHYHSNSLKDLWQDFTASFFNFDGKIWNTLKTLILKPGQLSKDYVSGKKIAYVPPLRMFLFITFIFFLLLNLIGINKQLNLNILHDDYNVYYLNNRQGSIFKKEKETQKQINTLLLLDSLDINLKNKLTYNRKLIDSITIYNDSLDDFSIQLHIPLEKDSLLLPSIQDFKNKKISYNKAQNLYNYPDSLTIFIKQNVDDGYIASIVYENFLKKVLEKHLRNDLIVVKGKTIGDRAIQNIYYSLFLLMPLSAFFLYLINIRRNKKYYPSIILAIHLHSFMLLLGIVALLVEYLNINIFAYIVGIILLLYSVYYLYRSIKEFYNITTIKSIIKLTLLLSLYGLIIITTFSTIYLITFFV